MSAEQDRVQLILLRILGVLFIVVGFALIAQQVRSDSPRPINVAQAVVSGFSNNESKCEWPHARIFDGKVEIAPEAHVHLPPMPPIPPLPPVPPVPPMPKIMTF